MLQKQRGKEQGMYECIIPLNWSSNYLMVTWEIVIYAALQGTWSSQAASSWEKEAYLLLTCSQYSPTNGPAEQKYDCVFHCPSWALKSVRTMEYI